MAATKTVAHVTTQSNSSESFQTVPLVIRPRQGVITLSGYGINARVDKGHLIVQDGVGDERRAGRFARVNHGICRLVVIGNDGSVSLAALRWLADQKASFVMLERDGSVLLTTGPVAPSDARLRRRQACVQHEPHGADIVRELIRVKMAGQERLAREKLNAPDTADSIGALSTQLDTVQTFDAIRVIESQAAARYWESWQGLAIRFPKSDLNRIPEHWLTYDNRRSPISGTARKPTNPVNAILNYLYTLLETETRLAIAALGLDPGFGLLHVDHATRDSLVYDLMEPIRPRIDEYVLNWVMEKPLSKSWFFELRDGSCRLMASITEQLTETAKTWGNDVAPIVEWFAKALSVSSPTSERLRPPGTRLTQRNRVAGARSDLPPTKRPPRQAGICESCGGAASTDARYCHSCALVESGKRIAAARELGRIAAASPEAALKKSNQMKIQRDAISNWTPADLPEWLDEECFLTRIQPVLGRLSKTTVAELLGVSRDYVYQLVRKVRVPHRRHWVKLAELVGVVGTSA
jgi:CRISPR-associated endonuclease Cas1